MAFNGFPFLLGFLPLVLAGTVIVARFGEVYVRCWLLVVSLLFYAIGAPGFLPLLVMSIGVNFLLLTVMRRSQHPGGWAAAGCAANLLVLVWFKYLSPDTALPLGLSFFTFTQIGALLHYADGEAQPPGLLDYALFTAFFPALLAGPILNPREALPQFNAPFRLTPSSLAVGSGFFLLGLLKKNLLADSLGSIVASGFGDPASLTLFSAWQTAAAWSLQLYFDFSGYSDMAIGLAWMFGIRFPDNFDQPYKARSVIDYWQRWHMSLTRFLMTNVHAPLTLATLRWRRSCHLPIDRAAQTTPAGFLAMIAMPVCSTMLLVSVWHGAAATFLLFGLLHIVFLLVNHAWRLGNGARLPAVASIGLTYLCVLIASVPFHAATVQDAGALYAGMIGWHGIALLDPSVQTVADLAWLVILYAIVWFAPTTRQIIQGSVARPIIWRESGNWAVAMGGAATLGLLAAGGTGEFLYFRF